MMGRWIQSLQISVFSLSLMAEYSFSSREYHDSSQAKLIVDQWTFGIVMLGRHHLVWFVDSVFTYSLHCTQRHVTKHRGHFNSQFPHCLKRFVFEFRFQITKITGSHLTQYHSYREFDVSDRIDNFEQILCSS
jgi:hypothetical protein